jgi:hypothetical protein
MQQTHPLKDFVALLCPLPEGKTHLKGISTAKLVDLFYQLYPEPASADSVDSWSSKIGYLLLNQFGSDKRGLFTIRKIHRVITRGISGVGCA